MDHAKNVDASLKIPIFLLNMDIFLGILSFFLTITTITIFTSISTTIVSNSIIQQICFNITHSIILNSLIISFHRRNFVEEKHEVDQESNDQCKKLDLEEVP